MSTDLAERIAGYIADDRLPHAHTAEVRARIAATLEEHRGMQSVPLADVVFDAFRDAVEGVIWEQAVRSVKAGWCDD